MPCLVPPGRVGEIDLLPLLWILGEVWLIIASRYDGISVDLVTFDILFYRSRSEICSSFPLLDPPFFRVL